MTLQNPHLRGSKNFSAAISGGYSNVQDITTFASIDATGRFSNHGEVSTADDTFIYDFLYRRVKVDPNSLQVSADLIPLLSQPVRVGGPSDVVSRYTRSPGPLDAVKGRVLDGAGLCGLVEVWVADGLLEAGWNELDVLPVWQAEVCICA